MQSMTRRDFHQQALGSVLTWPLLDTLFSRNAFGDEVKLIASKWLAELNAMSLELKGKKLEDRKSTRLNSSYVA